jgi:hypothetical protein
MDYDHLPRWNLQTLLCYKGTELLSELGSCRVQVTQ